MGAFAQLERALTDRQCEGIAAAKARGVYRGRARGSVPTRSTMRAQPSRPVSRRPSWPAAGCGQADAVRRAARRFSLIKQRLDGARLHLATMSAALAPLALVARGAARSFYV